MDKAQITVEGFIANDLEARTAGSHTVVSVSVPVTPSRRDESGNWVHEDEKTVWYEASFWDEHGATVARMAQKGTLVILTGTPELEVYTKRDGTPGAKIVVGKFPMLSVVARRPKRGEAGAGGANSATPGNYPAPPEFGAQSASYGDDTPF